MPATQVVMGVMSVVRQVRSIKRRASAATSSGGGAWGTVGAVAGTAVYTAEVTRREVRRTERITQSTVTPGVAGRVLRGTTRFIAWSMVLLYPFFLIGQSLPSMPLWAGVPFSPTYGQVFGSNKVPGYMSLGDVWRRIHPTSSEPPAGWVPTDADYRAALATYDWACTTPTAPVNSVTPAGLGDVVGSWASQTFEALGAALADEAQDPENLKAFGQWYFRTAGDIVRPFTKGLLHLTEDHADQAAFTQATVAYQTTAAAACTCATTLTPTPVAVGVDPDVFRNGQLPDAALVALRSAPGERLRPDAAAAFDRMAAAYAADMGGRLVVTDSYRTLAGQYAAKAKKGWLAAKPGTSNHGLGKAVDLGGGIDNFGTAQHAWMVAHAGEFGWHLPSWAQASGSKPEPWHWEFQAGVNTVTPVQDTSCPTSIGV